VLFMESLTSESSNVLCVVQSLLNLVYATIEHLYSLVLAHKTRAINYNVISEYVILYVR